MSRRLKTRDYATPGLYFVTICSNFKRSVFGRVVGNSVDLTALGRIARETWIAIPAHFACVKLHAFVVMPNHLHGIIEIRALELSQHATSVPEVNNCLPRGLQYPSVSVVVRSFKAEVTKRARLELNRNGEVWQRNYFDRVIRDAREFSAATQYIVANPLQWEWDGENLMGKSSAADKRLAQHAVPLQGNRQGEL
jgi:putative transposase